MEIEFFAIMIPIICLVGIFTVIIYLRKYDNIERMAMIEKGVSSEFLNVKRLRNTSLPLRVSLLMIGVGLGIFMGALFETILPNMEEEVAYFSMIFIFGGVGLGLAYIIEEKKNNKENS